MGFFYLIICILNKNRTSPLLTLILKNAIIIYSLLMQMVVVANRQLKLNTLSQRVYNSCLHLMDGRGISKIEE